MDTETECRPFSTLESILCWEPENGPCWSNKVVTKCQRTSHPFHCNRFCEELSNEIPNLKFKKQDAPKTLVCHDMKGGYLDDRFVNGCSAENPYSFFRWSGIDIFVYFSHHLLTIPPLGWINAAHTNGVTVLGTIITEGKNGETFLNKLLKDPESIDRFVEKVAQICQHYKFSGFLLNIENQVSPELMNPLFDMVSSLRMLLKSIDPDNVLIWYDAVTAPTGKVKYQNELNDKNWPFFDICDGIFLNYNWTKAKLKSSKLLAGDRNHDVFVGIDVFGRSPLNEGGMSSFKAMNDVHDNNLSVAIFAPGWVHESKKENESFIERDFSFWKSLFPFFYLSGPVELPFYTNFSVGYGENYYKEGQIAEKGHWYNLSKQAFQLSEVAGWHGTSATSCLDYYDKEAYNGGNCIILKCRNFTRLFGCKFDMEEKKRMEITVIAKSVKNNHMADIEFLIKYAMEDSEPSAIVLRSDEITETCASWTQRKLYFGPAKATVFEIGCRLIEDTYMLIGELRIELKEVDILPED